MGITQFSRVKMHYTLKLDNGEILETTENDEPLEFIYGVGEIIPGLERELEGMNPGEEKHIVVPPEEAYGPRNPNAVITVPREEFPVEGELEEGMIFRLRREDGMVMSVTIAGVSENDVTLDLNHPLAGKTLHFDVKIEEVEEPEA